MTGTEFKNANIAPETLVKIFYLRFFQSSWHLSECVIANYKGKIVHQRDEYEDTSIRETYLFGHPIACSIYTKEVNDLVSCSCGEMGLCDLDQIFVFPVTEDELHIWIKAYAVFHLQVMQEKGYDSCAENIFDKDKNVMITLYTGEN